MCPHANVKRRDVFFYFCLSPERIFLRLHIHGNHFELEVILYVGWRNLTIVHITQSTFIDVSLGKCCRNNPLVVRILLSLNLPVVRWVSYLWTKTKGNVRIIYQLPFTLDIYA